MPAFLLWFQAPDDPVTKRTRRTKKTTTTTPPTTTTTTTQTPINPDQFAFGSAGGAGGLGSATPLEVILRHPQVNIIIGNHSNDIDALRTASVHSRVPTKTSNNKKFDTRVAVDAPRHLMPLDFNPHELKRPYPAVYEVKTKFACDAQPHNPGVYADMSLGCKVRQKRTSISNYTIILIILATILIMFIMYTTITT